MGKRIYLGRDTQISRLFWLLASPVDRARTLAEVQRAIDGFETDREDTDEFDQAMKRMRKAFSKLRKALHEGGADHHLLIVRGGSAACPEYTMVLKTGTITEGRLRVRAWYGDTTLRPLVAALETHSSHTVAQALKDAGDDTNATADKSLADSSASDVRQVADGGLTGVVAGRRLVVGSPTFVQGQEVAVSPAMRQALDRVVRANGHARARRSGRRVPCRRGVA